MSADTAAEALAAGATHWLLGAQAAFELVHGRAAVDFAEVRDWGKVHDPEGHAAVEPGLIELAHRALEHDLGDQVESWLNERPPR